MEDNTSFEQNMKPTAIISREQNSNSSSTCRFDKQNWNVFGYSVPKQEVVFFCQVIALYIVIIVCLVEIILDHGDHDLWYSLLAGSIGYLLPNPSLNKDTVIVQHDIT
jgi:hypothetical protein